MKTVIIDSSSAILLFRCKALMTLVKYYHPVIPDAVFSELSVQGYEGSAEFTELCGSGFIKISRPVENRADRLNKSLHAGEREVILLFLNGGGDFILIDDGKGSSFCRDNNIPYINALLAVRILYIKKLVSDSEYKYSWNWLVENGRYSESIIDWAENAGEEKLEFFL